MRESRRGSEFRVGFAGNTPMSVSWCVPSLWPSMGFSAVIFSSLLCGYIETYACVFLLMVWPSSVSRTRVVWNLINLNKAQYTWMFHIQISCSYLSGSPIKHMTQKIFQVPALFVYEDNILHQNSVELSGFVRAADCSRYICTPHTVVGDPCVRGWFREQPVNSDFSQNTNKKQKKHTLSRLTWHAFTCRSLFSSE